MAWLALGDSCMTREEHADFKKHVHTNVFYDERCAGRQAFAELAEGGDPIYKEVLELETETCRSAEEPHTVK
eukprot:9542142-Karenia_brevis.AAC.1